MKNASEHLQRFWAEWDSLTQTEQKNWLHQHGSAVFLLELKEWQMPANWKQGLKNAQ